MATYKILVVDDDIKLGSVLKEYLSKYGHNVDHEFDSTKVMGLPNLESYDLAILDIMMPQLDGYELCKLIRSKSDLPILFLSARGETMDRIVGLEIGADDYLPKPFEPRELLARIESILRRSKKAEIPNKTMGIQKFGQLEVNPDKLSAKLGGTNLELTSNEFLALNLLIENQHKILSRDDILTFMQGHDSEVYGRAIDILISRIRQKLHDDPKEPKYIKTVRGQGYRFIGGELA